jgi:hypothetical protein
MAQCKQRAKGVVEITVAAAAAMHSHLHHRAVNRRSMDSSPRSNFERKVRTG